MTPNRIELLADDVWHQVFAALDNEPDVPADVAGSIASAAAATFRTLLTDETL
jgi:hypothetical protein